jgi:hypothetical protein
MTFDDYYKDSEEEEEELSDAEAVSLKRKKSADEVGSLDIKLH